MKLKRIKSLQPDKISDEELQNRGVHSKSFMSFERAIRQEAELRELQIGKKTRKTFRL